MEHGRRRRWNGARTTELGEQSTLNGARRSGRFLHDAIILDEE